MSADDVSDLYATRFGSLGMRPIRRSAATQPDPPKELPPVQSWGDASLIELSRDTRSVIRENPEGGEIGDWYDSRPHTTLLYYLAKWVNWPDPRARAPVTAPMFLEIGVRHGVTTLALLQAAKETGGVLVSVEIDPVWADAARKEVQRAGLEPWWICEVASSDDFFARWEGQFDLAWIDGDHGLDQSTKDIQNAARHLRQNGMLVAHDYYSLPWPCDPPACPPFPSFVSEPIEALRKTGDWEICVMPFSFGAAVCRKIRE